MFFVVFSMYLGSQLFWGQNGIIAKSELKQSVELLEVALSEKQVEIKALKRSLSLLDPANIDVDYVSEILRQELYWVLPNEYLIILPDSD